MARRNEKKDKKALLALLILLLAIAIIIGTILAFFSDFGVANFAGTAGTVEISVEEGTTGLTQYWTYLTGFDPGPASVAIGSAAYDEETSILNPGDYILLDYDVENEGSKSVWVKAVVGTVLVDGVAESGTSMFKLYAVPMDDIGGGKTYASVDAYIKAQLAGTPGFTLATAGDAIILDGTDETETDSVGTSANIQYILYFDATANNDYQGAEISLEIEVQALQYRNNTNLTNWTTLYAQSLVVSP